MAAALPSSTSFCSDNSQFLSNTFVKSYSKGNQCSFEKKKGRGKSGMVSCCSFDPITGHGGTDLPRRDLMLFTLSSSFSLFLPFTALSADSEIEETKMDLLVDNVNAYSFSYPLEIPPKKVTFRWIETRKPERYSSAAPLSADARQRIVSERVDMIDNVVISVSIGPPNFLFLKSKDKNAWKAEEVADSVLADKSALRISSDQRMSESSVLDAHSSEVNGETYWYYEYMIRKSPTKSAQGTNSFRHFVSTTAERDGYLYSLNASTLNKQWEIMGPALQKTVASFRLLPPTENYVPPYKDPWRFW